MTDARCLHASRHGRCGVCGGRAARVAFVKFGDFCSERLSPGADYAAYISYYTCEGWSEVSEYLLEGTCFGSCRTHFGRQILYTNFIISKCIVLKTPAAHNK